ncbi:MAG TPA: diguanylate cyclase, partial [Anaeromyxobacteraceae bacterium]|nr:diguanylate cyclase [Anaeromyxobacteraceae bacterium]
MKRAEAPGSCQNESKIMTALSATSEKETARILVVEDEAVVALDLEQVLEAEGYATRVATTGAEAITAARAQQPALVLMDVRLRGGMDGIDAARAIRQFSDVPVIFLTAFEDGPTIQRAADVEAYGYLVKPCHERALHGAIQVAICKHAKDAALRETMLAQATRDPLTGLFNRRYLDETFRREVAHANRSEAPLSVVLMDVDHFKRFNDVHGHAAGDAVLHEVANTLKKTFRISDVVCRYGGEEFLA